LVVSSADRRAFPQAHNDRSTASPDSAEIGGFRAGFSPDSAHKRKITLAIQTPFRPPLYTQVNKVMLVANS
jgi:hypothetical protein